MLITDIKELKKILDIDPRDKSEDLKLTFFIEQATSIIENYIGRPGLSYASRTEYYNGTGTQQLILRSRPVYTSPTIQVFVDESGYFGATSGGFDSTTTDLTYGDDFALAVDQADGTSRRGILLRINNLWPRPAARQQGYLSPFLTTISGNIKVIYTAGYTVDNLPSAFRLACNLLVAKLRYIFPLGMELGSESYEERSISIIGERKDYLTAQVKSILFPYRNFWW